MIKTVYSVGNKDVGAYIPKEVDLHSLEQLYDVCNELFDDDCFYSKDEVKELKKDKENKFLR